MKKITKKATKKITKKIGLDYNAEVKTQMRTAIMFLVMNGIQPQTARSMIYVLCEHAYNGAIENIYELIEEVDSLEELTIAMEGGE